MKETVEQPPPLQLSNEVIYEQVDAEITARVQQSDLQQLQHPRGSSQYESTMSKLVGQRHGQPGPLSYTIDTVRQSLMHNEDIDTKVLVKEVSF